jgi:tRNA/tmRNA/rRNA uracil-C5-methylase (TrmA/RlmC/RlmD family)
MDDAAFEAFFESGEREMQATLDTIRDLVGRDFHPARALDFGCGVGRLTIPLARESKHVLAVDISPTMLEEAQANCAEQEITNVEFIETKTVTRDANRRRFDFVLAYEAGCRRSTSRAISCSGVHCSSRQSRCTVTTCAGYSTCSDLMDARS